MKKYISILLSAIAIPLAVGALAALLSRGSMEIFASLEKPPLAPPGWLFPVAWTILYIAMGIASYFVATSGGSRELIRNALTVYGLQLLVNFCWPLLFFVFRLYRFSFAWLVLLWILILITIIRFHRLSKPAAYLLIPYLVWVTYAGYLNLGVAILN